MRTRIGFGVLMLSLGGSACVLDLDGQQSEATSSGSGAGGGGATTTTTTSATTTSTTSSTGGAGGAGLGGAGGEGGAGGSVCVGDGRVLAFDGVDDRMVVSIPDNRVERPNDFFVAAYIEPSFDAASTVATTMTIFELRDRAANEGFSFVISRTATDPNMSPRLEIQQKDSGNTICIGSGMPILTGQRVHVAASYSKPDVHVFVDGQIMTTECSVNDDLRPVAGRKNASVGWSGDLSPTAGAFYRGKLDQLIYRDVKVEDPFSLPSSTANCRMRFDFDAPQLSPDEFSNVLGICDSIDGLLGLGTGQDAADPAVLCGSLIPLIPDP
jgi:hypothetical protein